ncbi:hypothetical protein N0V94_004682 [Neodidymelliopsis sp. IMI 364377]|nr:hypothetical protein N0V94_004682 [Neodidymelliopsis sp. IMI 364377]
MNPKAFAVPSTPGSNSTSMSVQRNTPIPPTPGHRRIASTPRTPGTSPLTTCSASSEAFTIVKVHTAKCSECDKRNKDVMCRCPGCTFQVCRPCQEKREKAGRSLAHGNMLSPYAATPGTGSGSVVRRKPIGVAQNVEKKEVATEYEKKVESIQEKKPALQPASRPKAKPKARARNATPSDDSSDGEFTPDPASPTCNKHQRTELASLNTDSSRDAGLPAENSSSSSLSSLPEPADLFEPLATTSNGESMAAGRSFKEMSTNEIMAHYGVNTIINPYKAHLLSRHEPVVSNPVIEIPEVVKRGFKPRPSAEEIYENIQRKVRRKMGLPMLVARTSDGTEENKRGA